MEITSSCAECLGCLELQVAIIVIWHLLNLGYWAIQLHTLHVHVGRHCCIWCEISSEQLKIPLERRGSIQARTLESLKRDYERFVQNGANVKNAKLYNNVIHEYLWAIPIDQVHIHMYM